MKMSSNKRNNNKNKRRVRRAVRPELMIVVVFLFSMVFYIGTKIGLNSYNITLQMQEQELAREVNAKQEEVNQLETEINALQNKTRLLGMLDSSVKDNQNNIYIIDEQ